MPISFEVDEKTNVVYVKADGEVTEEDLLQYQTALMGDPRLKSSFRLLFDARTARPGGITSEAIHILVVLDKKLRETCPGRKTAIVVRGKLAAELAEEFERDAQPNAVVFFDIDVARIWLGI